MQVRTVTIEKEVDGPPLTYDVKTTVEIKESRGNTPAATGPSPVRSQSIKRYQIPGSGLCKEIARP